MAIDHKFIDLQNTYAAMPELKLVLKLNTLITSVQILQGNYVDLRNALATREEPRMVMLLWDIRNRPAMEAFQKGISRLLHNYVASALSLIDHTRNLYRDLYESSGVFADYQGEVRRRFTGNPLAGFVVGLRNYCQHYRPPPVFSRLQWTQAMPVLSNRLKLKKSALMDFDGWTAPAKRFLAEQAEEIDLIGVIDEYHSLVLDFHQWIRQRQMETHRDEFKRVASIEEEILGLLVEDTFRQALSSGRQAGEVIEQSLNSQLSYEEWRELAKYPEKSYERCSALISFLEKRTPIEPDAKERILELFR